MRNSTKERLKLLAAVAILAVPGILGLYQLYCAVADGLIFGPHQRRPRTLDWISYETSPRAFVEGLVVYGFLALLFIGALAGTVAAIYTKDRWRSRQFIDTAIRRTPDSET
jgi:hypothetical protein